MAQPIGPIEVQAPVPSILTTARNRTSNDFGRSALPVEVTLPEGASPQVTSAWRSGITWSPATCQPSFSHQVCPDPNALRELDADSLGAVISMPFWIYTPLSCEWVTDDGVATMDEAVRRLTDAHSAYRMARALWMGEGFAVDLATQPTLRRSATDVSPGGAALDLDDAVATLLGAYETSTGGNGGAVLHIPSILITAALGGVPGGAKIAVPEGNFYRGPLGSLVSPGPGYPWGTSAAGAGGYGPLSAAGPPEAYLGNTADEVWIYVSGPVEYALGNIDVVKPTAGQNLRINKHEVWGQRPAIFRFDPCSVFAAKVIGLVTGEGS